MNMVKSCLATLSQQKSEAELGDVEWHRYWRKVFWILCCDCLMACSRKGPEVVFGVVEWRRQRSEILWVPCCTFSDGLQSEEVRSGTWQCRVAPTLIQSASDTLVACLIVFAQKRSGVVRGDVGGIDIDPGCFGLFYFYLWLPLMLSLFL